MFLDLPEHASNYKEVARILNYAIVYNPLSRHGYLDYIGIEYRERKWFYIEKGLIRWDNFNYSPAYVNKALIRFVNMLKKYNMFA